MMAATFPLPDLATLLSSFMAEKLLVNDFVVNFGVSAADADETVNPVAVMAAMAVKLASLPNFFRTHVPPLYPGPWARVCSLPADPQRADPVPGLHAAFTILCAGP